MAIDLEAIIGRWGPLCIKRVQTGPDPYCYDVQLDPVYAKDILDLVSDVQRLRALIKRKQWSSSEYVTEPKCPWCGVRPHIHDTECPILDIVNDPPIKHDED